MSRIASLHMPKNTSITGSIHKICAGADAVTLTEISFGVPITNPTPGANTGGAITSSHGSPWTVSTVDFDIAAGSCIDGDGIAAFKTANANEDIPLVYYSAPLIDGPRS